ncbi:hypothetical protein Bca4012_022321 [Brassica carinata]
MERLTNDVKCPSGSATSSSTVTEIQHSSNVLPWIDKSDSSEKEAEIKTLSGLEEELEKKAKNPKQFLAELMGMASSAKANSASDKAVATTAAGEMSSSRMGTANTTGKDLESPTVSTAHAGAGGGASGVTHLGVVGRGVKRVLLNAEESSPLKKLAPESTKKADGNSS